VIVDLNACQGYACCIMEAPMVFDLDEDAGKVIVLDESPSDDRRSVVETAARACPAHAIVVKNG
jgi:ferredoxin